MSITVKAETGFTDLYKKTINYDKMIDKYKVSIKNKDIDSIHSMVKLSCYYRDIKDYKKMVKYYDMALNNDNFYMFNYFTMSHIDINIKPIELYKIFMDVKKKYNVKSTLDNRLEYINIRLEELEKHKDVIKHKNNLILYKIPIYYTILGLSTFVIVRKILN